jgi:hypothetical protein
VEFARRGPGTALVEWGGEPPHSELEFYVVKAGINLERIYVEGPLRRHGVAERMVREVARTWPNHRMLFTGMNERSRRLARRLSATIPNFVPNDAEQLPHREADTLLGFYDD